MVDLSSAPHPPSPLKDGDAPVLAQFDRFSFPVRYYFVDFSEATRFSAFSPCPSTPSSPGPSISAQRRPGDPFKHDVQDCGALFDKLLLEVRVRLMNVLSISDSNHCQGSTNFRQVQIPYKGNDSRGV